jgi:hypothetical protein
MRVVLVEKEHLIRDKEMKGERKRTTVPTPPSCAHGCVRESPRAGARMRSLSPEGREDHFPRGASAELLQFATSSWAWCRRLGTDRHTALLN